MTTRVLSTDVRGQYEEGRSDGAAAGAVDAQWNPSLVHNERAVLKSQRVLVVKPQLSRGYRAYQLGYERGYREETNP